MKSHRTDIWSNHSSNMNLDEKWWRRLGFCCISEWWTVSRALPRDWSLVMVILRFDLIESRAIIHFDGQKDTNEVARSKRIATPFTCESKMHLRFSFLHLNFQVMITILTAMVVESITYVDQESIQWSFVATEQPFTLWEDDASALEMTRVRRLCANGLK